MPNIVAENELFFTAFEPNMKNRFIMIMDGVPTYMVRKAERPKISIEEKILPHINIERYVKGKGKWQPATLQLYDPIVPAGQQAVMEWVRLHHESVTGRSGYADFYKKDITLEMLGPVGDIVSSWVYKGAQITEANFGELDWGVDEPAEINIVIRYDYGVLLY